MSNATSENDSKRPRVVANPYLKQKQPTTEAWTESSTSSSNTNNTNHHNNDSFATLLPAISRIPNTADKEPNDSVKTTTTTTTTACFFHTKSPTFGEKEPAVERLPSRNVSFGSAEILSVEELRQHASLYNNRSVRITGVVLHRLVAADGNVCLVVSDPNQIKSTNMQKSVVSTPRPPPQPPQSSSFPLQTTTTTPMTGIQQQHQQQQRRRRTGGSSRLLFSRKQPFAKTTTTTPLTKRTTTTPLTSMVTSLVQHPTVLVYAVSTHVPVNDVAVGDLVMIIGEWLLSTRHNTTVAAILVGHHHHDERAATVTTQHFLHARIVRNVNGTDMQLHDEALRMRRQHLVQQMFAPESKKEAEEEEEPILRIRPGCGPPPYYTDHTKEASV